MATRKSRPILYEVARRHRQSRESGWRRVMPAPPAETPARPAATAPSAMEVRVRPPRSVRIMRGRLQVDLGWAGMTVTGVGALVVLAVAFQAGMRYAQSRAADQPPATFATRADSPEAYLSDSPERAASALPAVAPEQRVAPARPEPIQPPPTSPPPEPAAPAFAFREGYHYVVVQHFPLSHLAAAQDAARFLRSRGVDCVIERGKDIQLIATEAFRLRQDDKRAAEAEKKRCEALKARIRELGKEFSQQQRSAGRPEYAFEQCYERRRAR